MSSIPILGQGPGQPDRFDREYGGVYRRDETAKGDLQDSELLQIETVLGTLKERYAHRSCTTDEYEQEAKERFFELGFAVDVLWYTFAKNGRKVDGGLLPEITIVGRVEKNEFDHDQKVQEITRNVLELDQPSGLIKSEAEGPLRGHQH